MLYANMANWITIFEPSDFHAKRVREAEKEKVKARVKIYVWNLIGSQAPALLVLLAAQALVMFFGFGPSATIGWIDRIGLYLSLWLVLKLILDSVSFFFLYDTIWLWLCLAAQTITLFACGYTVLFELNTGDGPFFPKGSPGAPDYYKYVSGMSMVLMFLAQLFIFVTSVFILMLGCHTLPSGKKEEIIDPAKAPHVITIQTL